ncbi:MAG: sigma-70 family RNA polymerase sigma factor [Verrucomicrobiaceae bacterium]|nr:sigma-70 family RNA polymerase sigma factor [Verrucomicrobiaceae bacterium]
MTPTPSPNFHAAPFLTTRWTRVCLAKADSEDGRKALADLCDAYYEPVVTYLRGVCRDADAAREMSHAFFTQMLGGGAIQSADRERGRFRSYLLGAVKHFASSQREKNRSLKRGAGFEALSMDDDRVPEVQDGSILSPDAAFDRQWALTMLERSLEALRSECVTQGKGTFFDRVRPMLTGDAAYGDQGAIAADCGMNVDALRVAVHRLKKRLRQCVKAEIAGTVEDATAVTDEMQILFEALGG